jgi:SSS family solute:Na+ symporter
MIVPIIAFFFMSFLIGIYSAGLIGGKIRNYYVAGNIIPIWVIVLSLAGQAIEIGGTYENGTTVMSGSFWVGALMPIGIGVSLILIGFFFAEPLHKMKLLTLPDFYFRKYDKKVETLVSVICVFSFMILIASNLVGVAMIMNYLLPEVSASLILIVVAILIMLYTMAGGLFAVTWNDILHVGVGLIGFLGAVIWLYSNTELKELNEVMKTKLNFEPFLKWESGSLGNWAAFLALALGDIVALDFMERVFAAKTPKFAKISCIISGGLTIFVGILLAVIGTIASLHFSSIPQTEEHPFLWFIQNKIPAGISMLVFMGLIGACISTIDGSIMACTAVITKNVIQQNFPQLVSKNKLLLFSRITAIPVTFGAILIAFYNTDPISLLIFAFDLVFASCLVPLALGIYWKKANIPAAFWSIILSIALRIILQYVFDGRQTHWQGLQTLTPPLFSLICFWVIAINTQPKKDNNVNLV